MEDGYKKFRQRLFQCSDTEWRLLSGSAYERPFFYGLTDVTDIDDLIWTLDICAFPPGKVVPENLRHRTKILTLHTEDVHPGFARLLITRDGRQEFYRTAEFYNEYMRDCGLFQIGLLPKGPAVQKLVKWFPNKIAACPHEDLCKFDKCWQTIKNIKVDVVKSVYCPYWPPEVEEWATRERPNGWPTSDDVKKIVGRGCHFVAKPHQSNPDDSTQWRFSFSQAEIILVSSWTDVQMYIYHVLRVIKSEVVKSSGSEDSTVLCTFYFKTLMFWACEEKRREFWNEENLENSVGKLLCQMIEWLIERRCPNYFIPENNMIDYLSDDVDLSTEISALLYYRENCSQLMSRIPKAYPRSDFEISVPSNFLLIIKLILAVGNYVTPLGQHKTRLITKQLVDSNEFLPEIKDLYFGISSHLQLVQLLVETGSRNATFKLVSATLTHFNAAIGANHNTTTQFVSSLSDSVISFVNRLLSAENDDSRDSTLLPSRSNLSDATERGQYDVPIVFRAVERLIRSIGDVLPAPMYFVTAAYRANFLHTALKDYTSAFKQCEEAKKLVTKLSSSLSDEKFVHRLPTIILTSEWSSIFDQDIQTVHGFAALYRFVQLFRRHGQDSVLVADRAENRSYVLRLCAIEFIRYVGYRCMVHLDDGTTGFRKKLPFVAHHSKKEFDKFSRLFLLAAVLLSDQHKLSS